MYYFIYDATAQSSEHAKEFAKIENRLLDFGIKDRIVKISPLKSIRDAVADAYKNKFNTIVTIGGDELFLNTITYLIGYPVAIGMLPLGKPTVNASILGIPMGSEACETLSARSIRETTLGKIDNRFFLSSCSLSGVESITIDSAFTINLPEHSTIEIINQHKPTDHHTPPHKKGNFTVIIKQKNSVFASNKQKESYFSGKTITINHNKSFEVRIDSFISSEPCSSISIVPNAIKCIVGKHSFLR